MSEIDLGLSGMAIDCHRTEIRHLPQPMLWRIEEQERHTSSKDQNEGYCEFRAASHRLSLPLETFPQGRQFANRFDERVGRRGAKSLRDRRATKHANGPHAGAMRHFDVLRRVADIHAGLGQRAELVECHAQRGGMRLAAWSIL